MYKGIYDLPWIKPFARILRAIPISSELRPREMLQSLRTASEAIRAGEVVCLFAEGQITRIGQLLPFRRGFEWIMKDVDAPIIPVALDGVWGSIFSFEKGRFLWKLAAPNPLSGDVELRRALPHTATPVEVRQIVQELMAEAWKHRKARMRPVASRLSPRGPPASLSGSVGRRANAERELRVSPGKDRLPGAALAEGLGGTEDGRPAPAALGAGRAGEFRGDASGQGASEPELHRLGAGPGRVRRGSASSRPL